MNATAWYVLLGVVMMLAATFLPPDVLAYIGVGVIVGAFAGPPRLKPRQR